MDYRGHVGEKRAILILVLEKQKKRCKVSQVKEGHDACHISSDCEECSLSGSLGGSALLGGSSLLGGAGSLLGGAGSLLGGAGSSLLGGAGSLLSGSSSLSSDFSHCDDS